MVALAVVAGLPSLASAEGSEAISIEVGANPTAGVPLSITVSGHAEAGGLLAVDGQQQGCTRTGKAWEVGQKIGRAEVGEGAFEKTYSVRPEKPVPIYICAYVVLGPSAEQGEHAYMTGEALVNVAAPTQPHLTTLKVAVRSHSGSTAAKPGATELLVTVAPWATLRLALKRRGHTDVEQFGMGAHSTVTLTVPWRCSAPGGVYTYAITATDAYGASLTRTGRFKPVSVSRCRALRKADEQRRSAEAREHHEQEEQRRHEGHESERQDERVRSDQRAYCEQVLGGNVEQVFNGDMIPAIPSEIETECYAHGHNYMLRGDPPVVVRVT